MLLLRLMPFSTIALALLFLKPASASSVNTWVVVAPDSSLITVSAHVLQVLDSGTLVFLYQVSSSSESFPVRVFPAGSYKCVRAVNWRSDTGSDSFSQTAVANCN